MFCQSVLAIVLSASGQTAEDIKSINISKMETNPHDLWARELTQRRKEVNEVDRKAWSAIKTKEDWEKFKTPRIAALRASLGTFPERADVVPVNVTRTIQGDGFVIENIVYESRPALSVTANVYSPAKPKAKMPGILIVHSHHNAKTQGELQDMGMTWARLGCYVLIPDQLGHGERRQHPFADAKSYPGEFKVGRQDYYFRYNVALQLALVGESLTGFMANDMMRGVDVLHAKPGIDKSAIILLGSVAGGGDPAGVTAALDPRISAVVPFNFGGPQPETKYPLPDDAETTFNYFGGGSWESTRGLRLSGRDGFLPWTIVASAAPRAFVHAHEFVWDQKRDPVWARYQTVYNFYSARDRLSFTQGFGLLQDQSASHCNNIGAEHRKLIYPALKKWFDIPMPEKERQSRLPAHELRCLNVDPAETLQHQIVATITGALAEEHLEAERERREAWDDKQRLIQLKQDLAELLGPIEPSKKPVRYRADRIAEPVPHDLGTRADGLARYVLLPPKNLKSYPVVIALAQGGVKAFLSARAEAIEQTLAKDVGVCVVELRGMHSLGNRGRSSGATSISATEQMLGHTVIGEQVRELRELIGLLKADGAIDGNRIALWADSFAPVDAHDRRLEVPLDAGKFPDQAEPGAALVALLTALYEKDIKAVYVRGGLVSYQTILESPFFYVPHDAIVPGLLTIADISNLVNALAPRAVRMESLVDGLNRPVDREKMIDLLPENRALDRFSFAVEPSSPRELAAWFRGRLSLK